MYSDLLFWLTKKHFPLQNIIGAFFGGSLYTYIICRNSDRGKLLVPGKYEWLMPGNYLQIWLGNKLQRIAVFLLGFLLLLFDWQYTKATDDLSMEPCSSCSHINIHCSEKYWEQNRNPLLPRAKGVIRKRGMGVIIEIWEAYLESLTCSLFTPEDLERHDTDIDK